MTYLTFAYHDHSVMLQKLLAFSCHVSNCSVNQYQFCSPPIPQYYMGKLHDFPRDWKVVECCDAVFLWKVVQVLQISGRLISTIHSMSGWFFFKQFSSTVTSHCILQLLVLLVLGSNTHYSCSSNCAYCQDKSDILPNGISVIHSFSISVSSTLLSFTSFSLPFQRPFPWSICFVFHFLFDRDVIMYCTC